MGMERPRLFKHGRYYFTDWSMADPEDASLEAAMHKARYDLANLTQEEAYRILAAAEAYVHLASHPADNRSILDQLRAVRSAVRAMRRKSPLS